ncbi:MAG TPA: glutamine amidotransferase [Microbacteriaceae bacterium]|nr:glutamine amidotransferase [Microbacteriaceae bacterium]HRA09266.1 glutamine amidotransferase [Microbacteriaceae bacterium]
MSETIRIVQLYPDLLGVTGDRGNVAVFETRLRAAGAEVDVVAVGIGEPLPSDIDVLVIGNGPLSAMRRVGSDLHEKRPAIAEVFTSGAVVFAVGAGAELLSHGTISLEGERVDGLGLFPFTVTRSRERRVGYIVADSEHGQIVGFEDHAASWQLDAGAAPLAKVTAGRGSIGEPGVGAGESIRVGEAYATNVQGPALPLNPAWADAMLTAVLARRGLEYARTREHERLDALARGAREKILSLAHVTQITAIGL